MRVLGGQVEGAATSRCAPANLSEVLVSLLEYMLGAVGVRKTAPVSAVGRMSCSRFPWVRCSGFASDTALVRQISSEIAQPRDYAIVMVVVYRHCPQAAAAKHAVLNQVHAGLLVVLIQNLFAKNERGQVDWSTSFAPKSERQAGFEVCIISSPCSLVPTINSTCFFGSASAKPQKTALFLR